MFTVELSLQIRTVTFSNSRGLSFSFNNDSFILGYSRSNRNFMFKLVRGNNSLFFMKVQLEENKP